VFTQTVWNGLALGTFYGLVGVGLAFTKGLWGILNIAQGEIMILGGYLVLIFAVMLNLPLMLAIIIGVIGTGIILALMARGTFHYTRQDLVNGFILSTGISLIIQNGLELYLSGTARSIDIFGLGAIGLFGVQIPYIRLIFFVVTIGVVVLTSLFLGRAKMGRYIRAAALNTYAAKLVGVNVNRVESISYIISGVLAAVAGVGLLILFVVTPYLGARYMLKGVAAMLLGGAYKGLGNIYSTFIAGLVLGLVESVGAAYTSMQWQDIFAFVLLYTGLILADKIWKH